MMRNPVALAMLMGAAALALSATMSGMALGEDAPAAPAPSKHQLMRDCMAKQKAANSGLPKEDLKNACKDVTKTEKQNNVAAKKTADQPKPPAN